MAPKIFHLSVKNGTLNIPVTVSTFEYPAGGWAGLILYTDDEAWGPVWDVASVNLVGEAQNPGPRRVYLKTYQDAGMETAKLYETVGILRVVDWKAVPMPFGKWAALAELCVADEDLAPYESF